MNIPNTKEKFKCSLEGPWNTEPDYVAWKTESGLPALVVRNLSMGHLCGYVAVPPGHPLYGKDYDTPDVSVHGGLTYAAKCMGRVCHIPEEGETDDVWWFGFDAGHFGDRSPGTEAALSGFLAQSEFKTGTYKTLDYMKKECELLAEQLKEIG